MDKTIPFLLNEGGNRKTSVTIPTNSFGSPTNYQSRDDVKNRSLSRLSTIESLSSSYNDGRNSNTSSSSKHYRRDTSDNFLNDSRKSSLDSGQTTPSGSRHNSFGSPSQNYYRRSGSHSSYVGGGSRNGNFDSRNDNFVDDTSDSRHNSISSSSSKSGLRLSDLMQLPNTTKASLVITTFGLPIPTKGDAQKQNIQGLIKKINDMTSKFKYSERIVASLKEELGEEYIKTGKRLLVSEEEEGY